MWKNLHILQISQVCTAGLIKNSTHSSMRSQTHNSELIGFEAAHLGHIIQTLHFRWWKEIKSIFPPGPRLSRGPSEPVPLRAQEEDNL